MRVQHHGDENFAKASELVRRALAIDPSYTPAAALLAFSHNQRRNVWQGTVSAADIAEGIHLARQALDVGRDDPDTLWQAAYALFRLAGETALALAAVNRALVLNPNAAMAWVAKGFIHAYANQPEPAIEALERALRLSPLDPLGYYNFAGLAVAHLAARSFEAAISCADRALHDNPRLSTPRQVKIVALVHLDRLDEARAEVKRMLSTHPKHTVASFRDMLSSSLAPELLDFYVAGLRLAGLPED